MTTFLSELKRRNVLRVAAAYAVAAWIIIEAGSVLLPTFGASESAFKIYVIIVIAGLIASLVLAWVFEVTPEGVKLEKNVDRSKSITTRTGRKLDFFIIGALVIALGVSVTLNVTGMREATIRGLESDLRLLGEDISAVRDCRSDFHRQKVRPPSLTDEVVFARRMGSNGHADQANGRDADARNDLGNSTKMYLPLHR